METLTREQAIKRIKDIINHESVDHILYSGFAGDHLLSDPLRGAVNELMAIFDIKNEEIMEDSSKTLSIEPIYLKLGGETIGQVKPGYISHKPIDITTSADESPIESVEKYAQMLKQGWASLAGKPAEIGREPIDITNKAICENLTRVQAIERIRELYNLDGMDHLNSIDYDRVGASMAIIDELMFLFDIKQDEI